MANWWDDPAFETANAPNRSPWDRFKDAYLSGALHSPFGAEGVARLYFKHVKGYTDEQINAAEKKLSDQYAAKAARDPVIRNSAQQSVVRGAIDLLGSMAGGVDPSYALAPGSTPLRRIAAQGVINAGVDAASQGVELHRGVRDKYDPYETGLNAAAGAAFQGGGEVIRHLNTGRMVTEGMKHPDWSAVNDVIVNDLEGGGTLEHPKVSKKGAVGPQQVMPETARDPGFGIRPWDGKSQADLARVGRQYSAALMAKYDGDPVKVLAAYNGGFNRVDNAIKKAGDNWLNLMPHETQAYVNKGMKKLVPQGSEHLGEPDFVAPELPDAFDQKFANDSLEPKPWDDLPTLTEFAKDNPQILKLGDKTSKVDLEQKPFHHDEENYAYDDDHMDENGEAPQPYYDYIGTPTPYQAHYEKTGNPVSGLMQDAFQAIAQKHGVHPFDVAEAYYNKDPIAGLDPISIKDEVQKAQLEMGLTGSYESNGEYKKSWSYAPYTGDGSHYINLKAYEKKNGPVGPLTTQALKDYAADNGIDTSYVQSHYFSSTGDPTIKEGVNLWRDNLAKEQMTPKEFAAYQKLPTNDPKVLKILKKYIAPQMTEAQKKIALVPTSKVAKAADTFIRMLKDTRGGSISPDDVHEMVTEWNKGTNYLLKGPDGKPLRIYHGTRIEYEGMPSELHNHQPPGYVMYTTDPEFATGYTGMEYSNAARIFPAYLSKEAKLGDFRNPDDVKKVYDWLKKQGYDYSLDRVKSGAWGIWENEKMYRDLGWDGSYMTEAYVDGTPHVNLAVRDKFVRSPFDPETYQNNTLGHKIVNTLTALLKDESGSLKGDEPKGPKDGEPIDPEEKLVQALKKAQPLSAEQKKLNKEARSVKSAKLDELQKKGGGLESYYQQLSSLKGSTPKVKLEAIRDQFTDEDVSKLLDKINLSNALLPYEKIKAQTALMKVFGTEGVGIPTPAEIKLLSDVYSPQFIQTLVDNRTLWQKIGHGIGSAINLPRSLMSSIDLSAPFRQGIGFVGKKEFWTALGPMFKVFGSEANSRALMASIHDHPNWLKAKKAGLAIVDPHSHFLADREEPFQSDWGEKIPGLGWLVKASNRSYSGFLNKLRFDVFNNLLDKYEKAGLATDTKQLKKIANFVNTFTGRGSLGKQGNAAAPALAAALYSPRLIASRVKMISSPVTYMAADPILRKEAWKSVLTYSAYVATALAFAKYATGAEVDLDPRSSDFGKARYGNTHRDVTGGINSYVRLIAEITSQSKITQKGEVQDLGGGLNDAPKSAYNDSLADVIERFVRSKESPVLSFAHDFAAGSNVVGEPFYRNNQTIEKATGVKVNQEVIDRFSSMTVSDLIAVFQDGGFLKTLGLAPSAILGESVNTYQPRQPKARKGSNWWDDPAFGSAVPKTSSSRQKNWWNDPAFNSGGVSQ